MEFFHDKGISTSTCIKSFETVFDGDPTDEDIGGGADQGAHPAEDGGKGERHQHFGGRLTGGVSDLDDDGNEDRDNGRIVDEGRNDAYEDHHKDEPESKIVAKYIGEP